jgi:hypothetical protein
MQRVFVDTARAFKLSPAPNPSRFSGVLERLAKALNSHKAMETATGLALAAVDFASDHVLFWPLEARRTKLVNILLLL